MRIIFSLLLCLVCFPVLATDYYFSTSGDDTVNTGLSIASPWKSTDKVHHTTFVGGDNIAFNSCDTWTEQALNTGGHEQGQDWVYLTTTKGSPEAGYVHFTSYDGGCGNRKARFDAIKTYTHTWTQVGSTNVWKVEVTLANFPFKYHNPHYVVQDGTRLRDVKWTTDEATTVSALTAGQFSVDPSWLTPRYLYVYTTDGASPSTHVMQFAGANNIFGANENEDNGTQYIKFSNLDFRHADRSGIQMGDIYQTHRASGSIVIENCDFYSNGNNGAIVSGDGTQLIDNYLYDTGGSRVALDGSAALVMNQVSNGLTTGNTWDTTRDGTFLEVNATTNSWIHHNTGTRGAGHGIELWNSSNDNTVEYNSFSGVDAPYAFAGAYGLIINGASRNHVHNNEFIGQWSGGTRIQNSSGVYPATYNSIHNNNFISPAIGWGNSWGNGGMYFLQSSDYNTLVNNIFVSTDDANYIIYDEGASFPHNVINNNLYWFFDGANSGFKTKHLYTDNTTLAAWQAYGYDLDSVNADPLFQSNYRLMSGSPAINAGLDFCTDKWGTACDIGAYELHYGITIR